MNSCIIGLVSTLGVNIGDELIREGILHLLTKRLGNQSWETIVINKHQPWTITPWWHPERLEPVVSRLRGLRRWLLPALLKMSDQMWRSRLDACDAIIQCGMPVFWMGCATSPWTRAVWRNTLIPQAANRPVLNLAAGSCFGWGNLPKAPEALGADGDFIRQVTQACTLSTARDTLTESIFQWSGQTVPLLPCAALLAARHRGAAGSAAVKDISQADGRILVNYMRGAGHYDLDGRGDPAAWEDGFRKVLQDLRRMGKVAFLCHNTSERFDAERLKLPDEPCILPEKVEEYGQAVAGARAALCNRLHASVVLAGMGIPSVAVGNDSRLLMVRELGLTAHSVGEVSCETLSSEMEAVLNARATERERLQHLADTTEQAYLGLLDKVHNFPA